MLSRAIGARRFLAGSQRSPEQRLTGCVGDRRTKAPPNDPKPYAAHRDDGIGPQGQGSTGPSRAIDGVAAKGTSATSRFKGVINN